MALVCFIRVLVANRRFSSPAYIVADNSGEALPYMTCQVWSNNPALVQRSLNSLTSIVQGIAHAGFADVVTGFGLLNEPFADCDKAKYVDFIERGMHIVRRALGRHAAVYVSDMFQDSLWNDGQWWLDATRHANTYLDSHYYQCFDESTRALSPRQHIAFTCQRQYERAVSCCYKDPPHNTIPSRGVSRMIGEWSASFDILPAARINEIMEVIATTGIAPYMDRTLSADRQDFLRDYVKAQMVSFEDAGYLNHAWFYWSIKMENAAFAEWDFLVGIRDGWFPNPVLPADTPSISEYGTCYDLLFAIPDNRTIVHEFPAPQDAVPSEHEATVDDDIVLTHGQSLMDPSIRTQHGERLHPQQIVTKSHHHRHRPHVGLPSMLIFAAILAMATRFFIRCYQRRAKYTPIGSRNGASIFPCDRKKNHPSSVKTTDVNIIV
jgi:glucan 1,3-beta-glucosidase